MEDAKSIIWIGTSYQDIMGFSREVRSEAGYQLRKVQSGLEPDDWKPFNDVGAGVREIRIRDRDGIYRVMYVAKFEEAIFVLHCFQKKTQATSKQDKEITAARYKALVNERKGKNG